MSHKLFGVYRKNVYTITDIDDTYVKEIFPDFTTTGHLMDNHYKIEEDEHYYLVLNSNEQEKIKKYTDVIMSTTGVNEIEKDKISKLSFVFIVETKNKEVIQIKFQKLNKKSYVGRKYFLAFFGEKYVVSEQNKVILFTNNTDIIYDNIEKKVSFKNFSNANRIIDLSAHFREITKNDIDKIKQNTNFDVKIEFSKVYKLQSKYLAMMIDSDILNSLDVTKAQNYASKYNKKLKVVGNKIVIETNDDIKLLYQFLYEKFYTSDMSQTQYLANSVTKV